MFFLGIDQSLTSTGLAVVSETGGLVYKGTVTPKKLVGVPRLVFIRAALQDLVKQYPGIAFAALEGYAYDVGVGRVFELGELGGLVRVFLHDSGIPAVTVPPSSLKLFVSGSGASDKEAMASAVLRRWKVVIEQNDECDAFGLAQVARSFHLNTGATRAELEVLKKLKSAGKKLELASFGPKGLSL